LLLLFSFHIWLFNINISFGKKGWKRKMKERKLYRKK
jgi:hypothetical protein